MPLNPLSFDTQESFEKALMEAGLRRGWTPIKGLEVAMSDTESVVEDILEHFGTKGMRWGVRKRREVDPSIAHIPEKTRKEASSDAEEFTRAKLFYGKGAGTRRKLIKAKVESKKQKDLLYAKAFDHFVEKTDLAVRASQAKRQRRFKDTTKQVLKTTKTVGNMIGPSLYREIGPHGYGDRTRRLGLDHSNDILEHFGTKGMRWGVRKDRRSGSSSKVIVKDKRKKIKTAGGKGLPAHPDAVKARVIGQKAKKSGTKALSNEELQAYTKRLQLETSLKRLNSDQANHGQKAVNKILKTSGNKAVEEVTGGAMKLVKSHMFRTFK